MSKVNTVLWSELRYKYSPNDNYHGTCYYGALRLLLKDEFDELFEKIFTRELIKNQSTDLNAVQPFAKYASNSKEYRFANIDESLHDEEGVLWVSSENQSHIVYFKDGEYYDDYMSLSALKDIKPMLIIVKVSTR